jgi:DNA-binding Lrp family transcriptional regulator
MSMSTTQSVMNFDDMRDADWAIVSVLRDGRANAPLIAEETGYSPQYVRERLGRMKQDRVVIQLGHGMYAVNETQVPEQEVNQ